MRAIHQATLLALVAFLLAPSAGAHALDALDATPAPPAEVSTWWIVGAAMNLVMLVTFSMIAWFMWKAIWEGDQWTSNPLLLGMAGIFTFCALSHGIHFEHAMLPIYGPWLGLEAPNLSAEFGLWARTAMTDPVLLSVDVATAVLGVAYWRFRREQGRMFRGAELSEDLRVLEQEARVMQDSVVQTSVEAQLLLEAGQDEEAVDRLEEAITESKGIVDRFFGEEVGHELGPGDLSLPEARSDA